MKKLKKLGKKNIDAFKSTTVSVLQKNDIELEDPEISASEDEEDETRKHQMLLEAVEKIKGKRGKVFQRNEASKEIAVFNLNEVGKERVKLNELTKTLKQTTSLVSVKEQLRKVSRSKRLPVPLSKPQAEKIKRKVAYAKVTEEVAKWDAVVKQNRMAEQIVYPLKQPEFRLETMETVAKRYENKNAFEKEVAKLLNDSENTLAPNKVLTVAEERALRAMSLEEARQRLSELQKTRALLSYKEAKARRQSKIKSKKFHRVLKKEKMKNLLKEFEDLQKTHPCEALEKLKELDKQRILERVTLKHKSTGKWAKYQKIRAKYNPESRHSLKEQVELSRKLTEKIVEPEMLLESVMQAEKLIESEELAKEISEPEVLTENVIGPQMLTEEVVESGVVAEGVMKPEILIERTVPGRVLKKFTKKSSVKDGEEELQKSVSANIAIKKKKKKIPVQKKSYVCEPDFSSEAVILDSMVPDIVTLGDDTGSTEGLLNIQEAFDGDMLADFKEEKMAARKKEQPEGIDLFLPGWGCWGGNGIEPSKRKRKRFFIKPIVSQRKDDTLGNVIISEEKDIKASAHQVKELPFPFTNVHQFQSMIRQPIGNTWNPEIGFKSLIAPRVITKIGKIIHPIDADALVLQKNGGGKDVACAKRENKKKFRKVERKTLPKT